MTGHSALGIDIGGTKIAAAVVTDDGTVRSRAQVATPSTADGDVVLAAVIAAADRALSDAGYDDRAPGAVPSGICGVGVATAGPVDMTEGTVSPVNIPAWRGYPLRAGLARRFGDVRMFGDGIAIAIAEHWLGSARGVDNALGMVVSTGVGGGLIQGGRVVFGAGGNAGHIGHMSVDPAGPVCVCGGVGCLEAIASGTSIARWYADQTALAGTAMHDDPARADAGRGASVRETPSSAAELADRARAGDRLARAAFERSARALGLGIAGAVTLLDLDRVVIGGGVAQALDLLAEPLEASYRRFAGLGFAAAPRVVRAELGADTGILGAAAVVLHPDRYWTWAG